MLYKELLLMNSYLHIIDTSVSPRINEKGGGGI